MNSGIFKHQTIDITTCLFSTSSSEPIFRRRKVSSNRPILGVLKSIFKKNIYFSARNTTYIAHIYQITVNISQQKAFQVQHTNRHCLRTELSFVFYSRGRRTFFLVIVSLSSSTLLFLSTTLPFFLLFHPTITLLNVCRSPHKSLLH